jgi:hypothetical protein
MENSVPIEELDGLLTEHVDGSRGYIHQEPYKGDIFQLFAGCMKGTAISGDELVRRLREKGGYEDGTEASELLMEIRRMWDEWRYAWDRCSEA